MSTGKWTAEDAPSQKGRVALVTGATSGLGKMAATQLAQAGATVILAARNRPKTELVAAEMRQSIADADIHIEQLDLSDLDSVRDLAERLKASWPKLDLLINNAGVMLTPYSPTEEKFEPQMGTNHLGHFALSLQLLPLLRNVIGSRIVVVGSLAHRNGKIDLDDLNWKSRKYSSGQAYCDSKLANLLFVHEMNRRLRGRNADPIAVAAHPGWSSTDLQRNSMLMRVGNVLLGQKAYDGALATFRAATDPSANAGDYFGPGGLFEMRGPPVKVEIDARGRDDAMATALWEKSEELTGVSF